MTGLLLAAALAASPAPRERCRELVTAQAMIEHGQGPVSRNGLFEYASCRETLERRPGLCAYLPGGSKARGAAEAKPTYSVVGSDGRIHRAFEFSVCDSLSAGYLFLEALARGASEEELTPYAARMLEGDAGGATASQLIEHTLAVLKTKDPLAAGPLPGAARAGLFRYLISAEACDGAPTPRVRRECRRKRAAFDALAAKDAEKCAAGDLTCRAMLGRTGDCEAAGRRAVEEFCRDVAPDLKEDEWKLVTTPSL